MKGNAKDMNERKRRVRGNRRTNEKLPIDNLLKDDSPITKLPAITDSTNSTDFALLIEKGGQFLMSVAEKQSESQVRIAEINKPIYEANLELEKQKIQNQYQAWTTTTTAAIEKEKREFRFFSLFAGCIVLFLMISAGILLYKNELQYALSIITLLVGLIGGFGSGLHWQKQQEKKPQKTEQS